MEIESLGKKIIEITKNYRYVLIILLIGLILMIIPGLGTKKIGSETKSQTVQTSTIIKSDILEDKLSAILSKVKGAGKVDVILTIAAGEEIVYQTNDDQSNTDSSSTKNVNTVTVTDANRNQTGLIKQVKQEIYQGAIIVCDGADDPVVRLSIVEAVSRITGLGANCISVLKMK